MNRVYRLVWSGKSCGFVAAAERSRSHRKTGRSAGRTGALLAGVMLATGAHAGPGVDALPAGGHIGAGSAQISTAGNTMTVKENSQSAAIDWQSFSVGSSAQVDFVQPNAAAVILNRVVGNEASVINGVLHANGQVFLLNSEGVLIGKGASINAQGFIASTLNISDADFMAGKRSFAGNSSASIINLGTVGAKDSGYVALLASQIVNEGMVAARLGTVALAAGDKVSLNFNGNSLLGVAIDKGALGALVANRQAILADGGLVILTAHGLDSVLAGAVNNTGQIQAHTIGQSEGHIFLLGDMQSATVSVGGTLDASAPSGGNGGTIETSAASVHVDNAAKITTAATMGLTGSWLVDPVDFTIAPSGGNITGATLSSELASTNVSLSSVNGTSGTLGNLNVNDAVSWSSHKLTLTAVNDINIDAVMTAKNTAQLDLEPGSGNVNFGFAPNGGFLGQVNFFRADGVTPRAGTGFLTINGNSYTVITSLGQSSDAATTPTTMTLQGLASVTPVSVPTPYGSYSAITGYYALGANINASATAGWNGGSGFTPIGIGNYTRAFSGGFDGLGHVVSNLTINTPSSSDVGLFPFLLAASSSGGFIRNVGLTNASITGAGNVGALVGYGYGSGGTATIRNAYSSGSIVSATGSTSSGATAGGLMGNAYYGAIVNSHSTATVSANGLGSSNAGGLVGMLSSGTISNSYATGDINNVGLTNYPNGGYVGTNTISGGLVGFNNSSTITNSFATGNVTANRNGVGGLVGYNYGTITNSYATGNVTSQAPGTYNSSAGGLVGFENYAGVINNCYETGTVTALSNGSPVPTGALVGAITSTAVISNSYWNLANGSTGYTVISGAPIVSGVTGLTLAQMMTQASYAPSGSAAGQWDFANTWVMYEGQTTPLLRSFLTPLTVTANGGAATYSGVAQSGSLSYSVTPDQTQLLGSLSVTGGTNVGTYAVTPSGLYSDQTGYLITFVGANLTIHPATLTETASATNLTSGQPIPGLGGSVAGFVGGDTLSNATTGNISWTTPATTSSPAGHYAIDGSGLSADNGNYVFTQATTNASALTITGTSSNPSGGNSGSSASNSGADSTGALADAVAAALLSVPAPSQSKDTAAPQDPGQSFFARASEASTPPSAMSMAGALANAFGTGTPLTFSSLPDDGGPTQVVSLSQAQQLLQGEADTSQGSAAGGPVTIAGNGQGSGDGQSRDVRVPVSRNSLAEIVNGGVKLPTGVEQQLFVVKSN